MTKPKYNESQKRRIAVAWSDLHRRLNVAEAEGRSAADCFGEGSPQYQIATTMEYHIAGTMYDFCKKYYNGRIPKDGDNCEQDDIREWFNAIKRTRKDNALMKYIGNVGHLVPGVP
jgi:hypothetical protein